MADSADDGSVLRPSLTAIVLVLLGLALWPIDEKLDGATLTPGALVVSQK